MAGDEEEGEEEEGGGVWSGVVAIVEGGALAWRFSIVICCELLGFVLRRTFVGGVSLAFTHIDTRTFEIASFFRFLARVVESLSSYSTEGFLVCP